MNIDANTPERDEFDGDPLNPKHIEAVCRYLKNSPRDNLKVQALEIIEAQQGRIEELFKRASYHRLRAERIEQMNIELAKDVEKLNIKPSLISRIVLWFKGKK